MPGLFAYGEYADVLTVALVSRFDVKQQDYGGGTGMSNAEGTCSRHVIGLDLQSTGSCYNG